MRAPPCAIWDDIDFGESTMRVLIASITLLAAATQAPAQQKGARAPLIDVHMHVWSDDPLKFPFAHPYDDKFTPAKIPASLDRVVKEMVEHGVTHCVLV